jgi:acyl-coenzyme A thioesterase 13
VEIPPEFEPLAASPFSERIGPLYLSDRDSRPVIGARIEAHHANQAGRAHGGLLVTMADIALVRAVRSQVPPGSSLSTVDFHIAFLDALNPGDWVEAIPSVDRVGRSLAHASCRLRSGERDVARAMGTVAVRLSP